MTDFHDGNPFAKSRNDGAPISRRELFRSLAGGACGGAFLTSLLSSRVFAAILQTTDAAEAGAAGETVEFPSGEFTISAYVARPKAAGKNPAVIVIHDENGLQESIRDATRRLASAGFFAIAPDLLSRSGGVSKVQGPSAVTEALKSLSMDGAIQDLNSTFAFAQKSATAASDKISAIGFGWGGWRTFLLAANQAELHKGVVYSGTAPEDGLADIQAAVMAHYAQLDFRITGNLLWTEKTLNAAGKQFTPYVYENVDHGFYDPSSPEYNAAAASLAWSRTLEFLKA